MRQTATVMAINHMATGQLTTCSLQIRINMSTESMGAYYTCELQFPFKLWPKLSQHIIHRCTLYWRFYGSC